MSGRIGVIVVGAALLVVAVVGLVIPALFTHHAPEKYWPKNLLVLYCSADRHIAQPIIDAFDHKNDIAVKMLGDTEATKTFGLVERLRTEKDEPQADLFWSSEPFGMIALAREGIVHPEFRQFASRARVIVYNTNRVDENDAPKTMHDLLNERFRGRIVMARPQFGTTRGHMGFLVAAWGEEEAQDYLRALKAHGVRLVAGNSSVVRAVAAGEADIGLTDTDDVYGAQREGLPVELIYVRHDLPDGSKLVGPMTIPNTVALVRGFGMNAPALFEFLAGPEVERMLAASDSHNTPMNPEVAKEFPQYAIPDAAQIPLEDIADAIPRALELCQQELGR